MSNTNFDLAVQFIEEQNATGDHVFIAKTEADGGTIEFSVTDSYHQGIAITLHPDGTYSTHPVGG